MADGKDKPKKDSKPVEVKLPQVNTLITADEVLKIDFGQQLSPERQLPREKVTLIREAVALAIKNKNPALETNTPQLAVVLADKQEVLGVLVGHVVPGEPKFSVNTIIFPDGARNDLPLNSNGMSPLSATLVRAKEEKGLNVKLQSEEAGKLAKAMQDFPGYDISHPLRAGEKRDTEIKIYHTLAEFKEDIKLYPPLTWVNPEDPDRWKEITDLLKGQKAVTLQDKEVTADDSWIAAVYTVKDYKTTVNRLYIGHSNASDATQLPEKDSPAVPAEQPSEKSSPKDVSPKNPEKDPLIVFTHSINWNEKENPTKAITDLSKIGADFPRMAVREITSGTETTYRASRSGLDALGEGFDAAGKTQLPIERAREKDRLKAEEARLKAEEEEKKGKKQSSVAHPFEKLLAGVPILGDLITAWRPTTAHESGVLSPNGPQVASTGKAPKTGNIPG